MSNRTLRPQFQGREIEANLVIDTAEIVAQGTQGVHVRSLK